MVWVSSAAPAKSMRTASTPDKSEIMVWVSSAAPAKSMRTASTPDKSEIMVWVSSAAPAKSMRTASTPDKSEIRMAWVSTTAPATEHADCLCSRPFYSESEIQSLSSRYERLLVPVL